MTILKKTMSHYYTGFNAACVFKTCGKKRCVVSELAEGIYVGLLATHGVTLLIPLRTKAAGCCL